MASKAPKALSGIMLGSRAVSTTATANIQRTTVAMAARSIVTAADSAAKSGVRAAPRRCVGSTSERLPRTAAAPARYFSGTTSKKETANSRDEKPPKPSSIWDFQKVRAASQDGKTVLVDTREPHEVAQTGRIPGALNIPVSSRPDSFHISDDVFEDAYGFERPPKDKEVVFYCKAGVRSRAAAALAKDAGWENVGEYPGSWLDWEANSGDVEKKSDI